MRDTVYNGKIYKEPDQDAQKAVSESGINLFRYYPKDRLVIVAEVTADTFSCNRFYPDMPFSFAEDMVYDADQAIFCSMYQAIDHGDKKATSIFRLKDGLTYVRVVLSVLEQDENGNAEIVVGMVEGVTDEITRMEEARRKEQALYEEHVRLESMNRALSSNFNNVYLVDLTDGNTRSYSISDIIRQEYGNTFNNGDYSSLLQIYIKRSVYKSDQKLFADIIDLEHLRKTVYKHESYTFNYRVVRDNKIQYFQCRAVKVPMESREYCVIAFRDINAEVIRELEQKTLLEEQVAVINGLSADYYLVMLVDYQKDTVNIQRAKDGDGKEVAAFFSAYSTWSEGIRAYSDTQIVDEKDAFYEALSREGIMHHQEDYFFNYKKIWKDGYRYVQFRVAYVELAEGYHVAIVGMKNIDEEIRKEVDQRMQLRAALAKSEQYKNAVLADAIVIYEVNLSKNSIEDEMWEDIYGDRVELLSLIGMSAPANYDTFHKRWAGRHVVLEDREKYEQQADRAFLLQQFESGHTESILEFRSLNSKNEEIYLRHTIFMVQDEDTGDIIAYCNVKDITEQKKRELQMSQYEQLFIATAANIYAGIIQIDLTSCMAKRIVLKNEKIVAQDVGNWNSYLERQLTFVHPDDVQMVSQNLSISTFMNMPVNEKNVFSYKSIKKNSSQNYNSFFTTTHMMELDGRRYGIMVTIDNTSTVERELKQKALIEDALARAESASKAKTTFLSNMSHDIRTPMNAIIGFTTLALTHLDNRERVKDYLGKIMSASNHLLSLINDILDMSRIESGRLQLEEAECSLSEIMHGIRNILQPDMKSKRLNFYIDTVDVYNENVICDKLRLNQVLLNLLGNAVKFTEPGGTISVRICQKASDSVDCGMYEFHVKDTGIGMSKEFLKYLFEPFERERTSTVSGIQGTGLGMPITKNIVEMMGGTIHVDSKKGEGTEFIVRLPMKVLETGITDFRVKEMEGFHALVVDDDFNTCDSVSNMLIQIGMRAEWTMSGKEAILRTRQAVSRNDEYRVYVIDWLIPDMNGIEIVRQIRKVVGEDVPIIILTAYDWSDIEEEARDAGVTAFCSKPLFISDLRRCLLNMIHPQEEPPKELPKKETACEHTILLVEDIDLNREIACEILSGAGLIVEEAENGKVALERLLEKGAGYYSLILMDIQMPVMDGYETTRRIRALEDKALANIPIIAMTADAFEEDKKKAMDVGMNAHIAKPIEVNKLLEELESILC